MSCLLLVVHAILTDDFPFRFLGLNTSYEYSVIVSAKSERVTVTAESVYGALWVQPSACAN